MRPGSMVDQLWWSDTTMRNTNDTTSMNVFLHRIAQDGTHD